MLTSDPSRRAFVRRGLYVAPAILTLAAAPQFAKAGSFKPPAVAGAPGPIPPRPDRTPAPPQAQPPLSAPLLDSPEPLPPPKRSTRRQDAAGDSLASRAGIPWTPAATHPQFPAASPLPADLRITEVIQGPLWCVDPKL